MSTEKPDDMVRPLALYQHITHGWVIECIYYGEDDSKYHADYVRISEPVTVTFAPLRDDSVIENALKMLDEMENAARMDLGEKLGKINESRANFRALTHQPEVA